MQTKRIATIVTVVAALTLFLATSSTVASPPVEGGEGSGGIILADTIASKISYQGRLTDAGGNPLSGNYNLLFQLWDDATAGSQVGSDIVKNNVSVNNGLFTVDLDVPQDAFSGQALWLQIQVNGQWLSPRQELLPAPYALSLRPGAHISGTGTEPVAMVTNQGSGTALAAQSNSGWGLAASSGQDVALYATAGTVPLILITGKQAVVAYGQDNGVVAWGGQTGGSFSGQQGVQASGTMTGVIGTADNTSGRGVIGIADNYGGIGVSGSGGFGTGVQGNGEIGVKGVGSVGPGVWGEGATGVIGSGEIGVNGTSTTDLPPISGDAAGVYGQFGDFSGWYSPGNAGVRGDSKLNTGVLGTTDSGVGVFGAAGSASGYGVEGWGVWAGAVGVYAVGDGGGRDHAALRADNTNSSDGMAAYLTNSSGYATAHLQNSGSGEVLVLQSNGGRFLRAVDANWDAKFRLEGDGNAYADFTTGHFLPERAFETPRG